MPCFPAIQLAFNLMLFVPLLAIFATFAAVLALNHGELPLAGGVFVVPRRARHVSRLPASNAVRFGGGAVRFRKV